MTYTEGVSGRALILLAALSWPLAAQLAPTAADYPAHAKTRDIELGARYLPHGLPAGSAISAAKDRLVVDVGVFPDTKNAVKVSRAQFTLNVDGKELAAVRPQPEPPAGSGTRAQNSAPRNDSVQLGGAPQFEPSRNSQDVETLPRRPISLRSDSATASSSSARKMELPEGLTARPVSGYLFFHFVGDPNSIRSIELIYSTGGVKTRVRIL